MKEYNIGQWIKDNDIDIDTTKFIDCRRQGMTSLEGLPEGFNSTIDCLDNNLTSLKGPTNLDLRNLHCDWEKEEIEKEYLRLNLSSLLI